MNDLKISDSISINGVCLTVAKSSMNIFTLDIVPETLEKSNLNELLEGDLVNLERAMKVSDRFGGHILQLLQLDRTKASSGTLAVSYTPLSPHVARPTHTTGQEAL